MSVLCSTPGTANVYVKMLAGDMTDVWPDGRRVSSAVWILLPTRPKPECLQVSRHIVSQTQELWKLYGDRFPLEAQSSRYSSIKAWAWKAEPRVKKYINGGKTYYINVQVFNEDIRKIMNSICIISKESRNLDLSMHNWFYYVGFARIKNLNITF